MLSTRLRKLRHLSLGEVGSRSRSMLRHWWEERCDAIGLRQNPAPAFLSGSSQESAFEHPWLDPAKQVHGVNLLQERFPTYVEDIQAAARAVCNRQFTFFGVPVQYGAQIPWCADPPSGKAWPMRFHTQIDIFRGETGHGDVKFVWELNRHQFLPTLGKAYRLTGDAVYADTGIDLMMDWIRANPYKRGINWASALEVAVRSVAWCWALALFEPAPALEPATRQTILRSLYQHGTYLAENLSFYFSPYNHLVGEATALFVLGSILPGLRVAQRWQRLGWSVLESQMPRQFHADGGTVEQASGYHHFTLGFYVQAILLRHRQGLAVSPQMWKQLDKAFEFAMRISRPDGSVPMLGDGDEGKALDLQQPALWDFRPYLALGAVMCHRGDFKKIAGAFPPDLVWLVGAEGWEQYQRLDEIEPAETSGALPGSGYYVMRSGWDSQAHYLLFDCGEIAAGVPEDDQPSAAHGHADALSLELAAYGKPLLIDPGFYTYNGDLAWHRYFRETAAHNTVVVDDKAQAEYRGRLKWSHAPRTRLERWVHTGPFDYVEGYHEGYTRLPTPVVHRRAIAFLKPDLWLIRDELTGAGSHQCDRYFHLAPGSRLYVAQDPTIHLQGAENVHLTLCPVETEGLEIARFQNGEAPDEGWVAVGYERKVRAPVLRYRMTGQLPLTLHMLLMASRERDIELDVVGTPVRLDNGALAGHTLAVTCGDTQDLLFFAGITAWVTFHSTWQTDAQIAWVRVDRQGEAIAGAMVEGSELSCDGRPVLQAEKRLQVAAFAHVAGQACIELSEAAEVSTSIPGACVRMPTTSERRAVHGVSATR